MGWRIGPSSLSPGQSARWWFHWSGWPGQEVIGVQPTTSGSELRWSDPGVRMNADGSTTYFMSVRNTGPYAVQFYWVGNKI
ncbi:hypothetical protein [Desmospora profundinema]|uniref:Uncharacterized protein n=1 Tax=Desmospora profundinema TaxID=1571184 RepID=A0ABU1ILL5_9BACL|nr:hypothetical protein [Desmospora profundinema]MDR6225676.1 hypothetical protein [Desmospora profundinema]